ncbi:hypothetical protein N0V83_005086 [Neocucurbitaria cava]|uniref:Uncharacterized protein n=1 Tax=Neocucurbitaria cava TaxID=798079 RepID=A0A9W8Y8X9_9PLEO|nr:hypothetical protein N0V83_005086 [Neocucurbitaria cava]
MEHFVERWVYFVIYEAVQSSVIRPDNSDMQCRDAGDDDRGLRILGLRRPSPPLIRDAINKLLRVIGWGQPLASQSNERKPYTESAHTLDSNEGQTVDIGATTRVTNVTPLELALARAQDQLDTVPSVAESFTIPINALDDPVRPTTPPSPTASIPDQEDNDPRIRITNREGIVEMEVRLPPRILSTHTEVADISAPVRSRHRGASRNVPSISGNRPYHRVTQLSTEPAKFINAVVKAQIVGVALLPIRLVVRRLIASHYLAGQPGYAGLPRVVKQLPGLSDLDWRSIGVEISRLALCGALELTIDLGFWGLQYLAVTNLGKHIFGWGTL